MKPQRLLDSRLMLPLSMARATRLGRRVSEGASLTLEGKAVNSVPSLGYGFPLSNEAIALPPHMKITDLLLEVDRWTGFSRHLTRVKTGQLSPCA